MAAQDTVNRVYREYKRYTGDGLPGAPTNAPLPVGDPSSNPHNPNKAELRAALLAVLNESVSARFKGSWSGSTTYETGDMVESGGSVWKARASSTNATPAPGSPYWELFLPGATVADGAVTFAKLAQGVVRQKLIADITLYVRKDGSDSNSGQGDTSLGAFLTIGRAVQEAARSIDLNGRNVTIQVRAGTYSEVVALNSPLVGGGALTILGDTANWDNVAITGGFQAYNGAQYAVRGLKIGSTAAGTWSIFSYGDGSLIKASHINFGAVTGGGDHLFASDRGSWWMDGPYKITGGALNHYHVTEGGHGRVAAQTVPVTGTPNFTGQFAGVASGDLMMVGVNFSGAATGRTYLVHLNGVIRAALDTRNVFPGNIHGIEQAGGRLDYASCFSSHKNGVDQSITGGDWRQVTLGTVGLQRGGDYNAGFSAWLPRAGAINLSAQVTFKDLTAGDLCGVSIFKNGSEYKSSIFLAKGGAGFETATISIPYEETDGSAVYLVYARAAGSGTRVIAGSTAYTWFNGRQY